VSYLTLLAWIISTSYYQIATFIQHIGSSLGWLGLCATILLSIYFALKKAGTRA